MKFSFKMEGSPYLSYFNLFKCKNSHLQNAFVFISFVEKKEAKIVAFIISVATPHQEIHELGPSVIKHWQD